jgi:hypothetical protein
MADAPEKKKSPKMMPRPRTESELNLKWETIAEMAKEARAFAEARIMAVIRAEQRRRTRSSSSASAS